MIKFNDLKMGDYVMGEFEGKMWEGEVVRLNNEDKQVCVETDVQEFWFEPEHLYPIPLNDEALKNLGFEKEENEDGTVKYKKASFRLVIPAKDDFSHLDMWYREDRRHNPDIHYVHQLQNAHLQMTKIHLTREPA
jgi:hypothetical protein